jgi:hypothetical protein
MYYANFDDHITEKLGMILENWPPKKFCHPAEIGSQTELKVLIDAFESGATRFQRLSPEELPEWQESRFQDALNSGVNGQVNEEDTGTNTQQLEHGQGSQQMEQGTSRDGQQAPFTNAINTVTTANGSAIAVVKKPRKTHSDKGKKRASKK